MNLPKTVMVVDDEAPIVEFMTEALTDEGYTVYSATDGNSALAALVTQTPDLILCDLHMPGLTGTTFLEYIHRSGRTNLPVVMMTADLQAAKKLTDESIVTCLIKPFDLDELYSCVSTHIRTPKSCKAAD